jgi:SSS family solute:Na+ symporter
VAGIGAALILPMLNLEILHRWPLVNNFSMNAFPLIFLVSIVGSILGTLLTKPEDDETLKKFYKSVRPWGFWKPVYEKVIIDDPSFERNKDFWKDMFNVLIGIVWQTSLIVFPIFLVLREWKVFLIALGITIITSVILKFTWWNKLKD